MNLVVHMLGGSSAPAEGFETLGDDTWRNELAMNLMPAIRLHREIVPVLKSRGSGIDIRIISIPSALSAAVDPPHVVPTPPHERQVTPEAAERISTVCRTFRQA